MTDIAIPGPPAPPHRPITATSAQAAVSISEADAPFVDLGDGSAMQLLQVDLAQGIWVVRLRFDPGYRVARHYHTGPVYAFTTRGAWWYLEYPDQINRAGSFLFEPAGSVHTLMVPDSQEGLTEVWFTIFGANVDIDATGAVTGITDAAAALGIYRAFCRRAGVSSDKVLVSGA
ncbi:MAG: 2,4'-dihydroxyacetophenone dioxygenase family protein [Phenylobacterium sp.]|nr:2,4'-dihydroxyacetophenone dioxygenase family protein [Phenylobacterium sp.]